MLRVQTLFSRLAVGRPMMLTRPLSHSAFLAKNSTLAAIETKPKRTAAAAAAAGSKKKKTSGGNKKMAKKAAKPKAAKPKAAKPKAAKPKAAKRTTKKELTETIVTPPIKGPTAYNLFVKEQYVKAGSVRGDKPSIAGISRESSGSWKSMSEAEKQPYEQKSQQERKQQEEKLRQWWSTVDRSLVKLENRRRRRLIRDKGASFQLLKDPFLPKRPHSAFVVFCVEKMPYAPGSNVAEKAKSIAVEWNALSDKQKEPYVKEAQGMAEQYKKEMDAYNARFVEN
ncbi:hypothetical protein J3B02_001224 [Coemansia erecta]|nr:hypothetical protein J3B02_001224 [Coemansia erecta]